ncbi:MAG: hypothetical protein ABTD50_03440 [Polyangiaceae bacterium]|jgi:hypothetical protein
MMPAHALALVSACLAGVAASACNRTSARASSVGPAGAPLSAPGSAAADDLEDPCGDPGDVLLFVSPEHPYRSAEMRIVAVTARPVAAELAVSQTGGGTETTTRERRGATPYYWIVTIDSPGEGEWHAQLRRTATCGGDRLQSRDLSVDHGAGAPPWVPRSALWATRADWSPRLENLYSAWVEHLFDAPLDEQPAWSALRDVLRDPVRNFLFGHLSPHEDDQGLGATPDCADLPYVLRAYFAYKLGLPFGWSHCSRGDGGAPPHCSAFATSSNPFPPLEGRPQTLPTWAQPPTSGHLSNAKRLAEFFRTTLADAVQSGAGRTPADDEAGDYYPTRLSVDTLRPGTIFADPYGHVLVVAKRVPQSPTSGGMLLAVDGQPDGTVARKRFWRGNFLFALDPSLGSAGFKRFRPVVRDRSTGELHALHNDALRDYSLEQYDGVDAFYDRVDAVLSPAARDPVAALLETVDALEEQIRTRVLSLDNGRKFLASARAEVEMPEERKIFEATGPWEDFSTPSRDLRLLIAIDVARAFPSQVLGQPARYVWPVNKRPAELRAGLDARLERELVERRFTYTRSDGSEWALRLEDVVSRQAALEMAYNPNDCVERRWGAPEGSDEASTCAKRASAAQARTMESYRPWFHERRRPPR